MKKSKKGGFIVTAELILIATILVIGMIVGMVVVRDAVVAEMDDVAESIGDIDQSFTFNGVESLNDSTPVTAGSAAEDAEDTGAGDGGLMDASTILFDTVVPTPNVEGVGVL